MAKQTLLTKLMEITGADDIDEDGPVETCPTYHDILLAASVISRYIPSFTRHARSQQSHTLVSTAITNY